jgi:hypothetical protein
VNNKRKRVGLIMMFGSQMISAGSIVFTSIFERDVKIEDEKKDLRENIAGPNSW